MSKRPDAKCKSCYSPARVVRHTTFAYWYCDHCKDEVSVMLIDITRSPRGLTYAQDPDDIVLSAPGIYSITYVDGSHEWYEHASFVSQRDTHLRRALVSSSFRLADLDMPDRIKVQSVPKASAGAKDEGLSLRTVSDAPDSLSGAAPELKVFSPYSPHRPKSGEFITRGLNPITGKWVYSKWCDVSYVSHLTEEQVRQLAPSYFSVQHGSMPPDDTL